MADIKGSYRTEDGRAQLDWSLKFTGLSTQGAITRFSVKGHCDDPCGSLEAIAQAYPDDAKLQRICEVAKVWHLNDMHAGCVHQRELGWGKGKDIALSITDATPAQIHSLTKYQEAKVVPKRLEWVNEALALITVSKQRQQDVWRGLFPSGYAMSDHDAQDLMRAAEWLIKAARKTQEPDSPYKHRYQGAIPVIPALTNSLNGYLASAAIQAFPVQLKSKVFEGSIKAPCPVCGYRYGTQWRYEPLPDELIEEIKGWGGPLESFETFKTENFLKQHGIALATQRVVKKVSDRADKGETRPCWFYNVTLRRDTGETVEFEFRGSILDAINDQDPSEYEIMACVASDIHCPDTFEDFCSEYGYDEDSRKAFEDFTGGAAFAKKLNAFFTEAEKEEMGVIQ